MLNRSQADCIVSHIFYFFHWQNQHGFGLPHTDENMYNSDMGNCLDYTSTPANNMHPGDVNFNRLASMYISGYDNVQEYNEDYDDKDGKRRFLRRVVYRHYLYV
jgi:hypothetical protein